MGTFNSILFVIELLAAAAFLALLGMNNVEKKSGGSGAQSDVSVETYRYEDKKAA